MSRVTGILALFCLGPYAAEAQSVRGRVVDESTRRPISDVSVVLQDSAGTMVGAWTTGSDGFFLARLSQRGVLTLVVSHPGYAEHRQPVTVREADEVIPAIVLRTQVIELEGIRADAAGRRARTENAAGFRRNAHVVDGARMAEMERHGLTPVNAIRELGPLRVFTYVTPAGRTRTCIESIRRMDILSERQRRPYGGRNEEDICQWVVIVIDDVVVSDPETTLRGLKLQDFESVEYIPPADAGFRYGPDAAALGAVVLWTRGRGPHASAERNRIH